VNIAIHPDRQGGRPAGKPLTGAAASPRDPATAVRAARRLMLDGLWRTVPKTGDDLAKAEYTLRVHVPAALAVLPRSAIAGLTRRPPAGGCAWCVATFHAATSGGADPAPERSPFTETFLGGRCGRCRMVQQQAEARATERAALDVEASVAPSAGALGGRIAYWSKRLKLPREVMLAAIGEALHDQARAQDPPPPRRPRASSGYYRRTGRRMPRS
jgi:hypothetical protein